MRNILAPTLSLFLAGAACTGSEKPDPVPNPPAPLSLDAEDLRFANDVLAQLNTRCDAVMNDPTSQWSGRTQEANSHIGAFDDDLRGQNILGMVNRETTAHLESCSCTNGQFRHMIPEETLECFMSTWEKQSGDRRRLGAYGVAFVGIGLPIPAGAIHDPSTGSTTDNDGTYGLQFINHEKDTVENITIYPQERKATVSRDEGKAQGEQKPLDYQTAVGLRVRALTDVEALRQKFDR